MVRGVRVLWALTVLWACCAGNAWGDVTFEDAGTFQIEHTATLTGQFREAEVWVPVPLNWPQQTVWDVGFEPEGAEFVLDESGTVGVAVLQAREPTTLRVRYTVRCHPPRFDMAALAVREYPPYDTESTEYVRYTSPATHIESDAPEIVALGERFAAEHESPYHRARAVYDHVMAVSTYEDGPGRGALAMLRRGRGCCADYAQLFAAICRAAGIPAREVAGFIAGRENNWHSWAEFMLPEVGWVPCDPQVGDGNEAAADRYFGGLGGSPYVALSKLHDFTVTRNEQSRTVGFIQSGHVQYRGQVNVTYGVQSTTVTPVRYAAVLAAGGPRAILRVDLSAEELLAQDARAQEDGMRCTSLTVAPGPSGLTYGAVWTRTSQAGERSILYPRLTLQEYEALLTQARAAEMMPVAVSSCVVEGEAVYAAAFGEDGGREWSAVSGMAREGFMDRLRSQMQAGSVPATVAVHQVGERVVCTGVFARLTRSAAVSSGLWVAQQDLEPTLDRYRRDGLFPAVLSATAGFPPYFHMIGVGGDPRGQWRVVSGVTGEELEAACGAAGGMNPVSVAGY